METLSLVVLSGASAAMALLAAAGVSHAVEPSALTNQLAILRGRPSESPAVAQAWGLFEAALGLVGLGYIVVMPHSAIGTSLLFAVGLVYFFLTAILVVQARSKPGSRCACTGRHSTPITNWSIGRSAGLGATSVIAAIVVLSSGFPAPGRLWLTAAQGCAMAVILWHLPAAAFDPRSQNSPARGAI